MKVIKLIAIIIFSIAVFFFVEQFDLFKKKSIEGTLLAISKEINKKTPYQLDQFTILESTVAIKNTLTYKMMLINFDIQDKDIDFNKNNLSSYIKNTLCKQENTKKILSKGAIYQYIYSKEDGEYLFTLTLDNNDCLGM